MKFEAPRGTQDILPAEQPLWRLALGEAERLCALYGYRRIQTPVFEDTALFARTAGEGSDVVQKEMYTFADRGDRSLTLRPEGTAPICRAYVEHGLHREPQPQKLYTIAPMYRYSAPQKGRYREHFAEVRRYLDTFGVRYELVPTLVRGLDYYTRTTWEFAGEALGAQSSLCGGGRYDGLIEEIGGPPTPGVGFGAGIERLLLALEEQRITVTAPALDVFFALEADAPRTQVLGWIAELRARGVACDTDYAGRSLRGQLTQAARSGAATTVVVSPAGATIRRTGTADEAISHDAVLARLAP